jgi:hypothetical protein
MSSAAQAAFFDRWRAWIDELLDEHADMGVVEHAIDAAHALDGEEKDALWLWANGRRERIITGALERPIIGSTASARAGERTDIFGYPKGSERD